MQRFEGLTFARQGLQVATLVVVPLLLVCVLIGGLLLFPQIGNINEALFIIIAMLFLGLAAFLTLRAYFKWAVVPCTVEFGDNKIIITLEKRSLFYVKKQRVFPIENISNAACNIDTRLGKSFITLSTRKPKASYTLQYLDDRADDENPLVWQQIDNLISSYNEQAGKELITARPFFASGFMRVILFVSGGFFVAFTIAMLIDSSYRTWDRMPTYVSFGVLFSGTLGSYLYSKKKSKQ